MRRTPAVSIRRNRTAAGKRSSSSGRLASAGRSAGTRNRLDQPEVSARKRARSASPSRTSTFLQPAGARPAGSVTMPRAAPAGSGTRPVRGRDRRPGPAATRGSRRRFATGPTSAPRSRSGRRRPARSADGRGGRRASAPPRPARTCPAPHPGQVPRVDGPAWDAERRVAEDRPFEARPLQVAEKGRHVEERRLPAGVRSDEDVERSEPLRHVAQGPVPERLDARHDHVRRQWYTPGIASS